MTVRMTRPAAQARGWLRVHLFCIRVRPFSLDSPEFVNRALPRTVITGKINRLKGERRAARFKKQNGQLPWGWIKRFGESLLILEYKGDKKEGPLFLRDCGKLLFHPFHIYIRLNGGKGCQTTEFLRKTGRFYPKTGKPILKCEFAVESQVPREFESWRNATGNLTNPLKNKGIQKKLLFRKILSPLFCFNTIILT